MWRFRINKQIHGAIRTLRTRLIDGVRLWSKRPQFNTTLDCSTSGKMLPVLAHGAQLMQGVYGMYAIFLENVYMHIYNPSMYYSLLTANQEHHGAMPVCVSN